MRAPRYFRQNGFTLIELVIVIVLLGITAVTLTKIFTGTVSGYLDTSRRQDSASAARLALDFIDRELREAMPVSVRVSVDNHCIQFLPILASSVYVGFPTTSQIQIIENSATDNFVNNQVSPAYVTIYPATSSDLYDNSVATYSIAQLSGINAASGGLHTVTLATTPTFRESPAERLYIVGNPISYCLESGGKLNRYTSTSILNQQTQPTAGNVNLTGQSLLVDSLDTNNSTFTFSSGNLSTNGLVSIVLAFTRNGETLSLDHEVWLRNAL